MKASLDSTPFRGTTQKCEVSIICNFSKEHHLPVYTDLIRAILVGVQARFVPENEHGHHQNGPEMEQYSLICLCLLPYCDRTNAGTCSWCLSRWLHWSRSIWAVDGGARGINAPKKVRRVARIDLK